MTVKKKEVMVEVQAEDAMTQVAAMLQLTMHVQVGTVEKLVAVVTMQLKLAGLLQELMVVAAL